NGDVVALEQEHQSLVTEINEKESERRAELERKESEYSKQLTYEKIDYLSQANGMIADLANLAVKDGKDAANQKKKIATMEAIVYGGLTQAKVWSDYGYPAGIAPSIAAGIQTGINVATIQSANYTNGGVVAGSSMYGDNNII